MGNKNENKKLYWWQKDEEDYNSLDKAVMEIDKYDYEDLPKWKKKLYDSLLDEYYSEEE